MNKNYILKSIPVILLTVTVSIIAYVNQQTSDKKISALVLSNIEAFATNETGTSTFYCCGNCCTCAKSEDGSIVIHGHLQQTPCN